MSERELERVRSFREDRIPSELTAHVTGNVPIEIKELPVKCFAGRISLNMRVTAVSAFPSRDDPKRVQGQVTVEIDVTPCKSAL